MVAEQGKIEVDAAFTRLRSYARNHNQALAAVARAVVEGRLDAAGLERRRGAPPR